MINNVVVYLNLNWNKKKCYWGIVINIVHNLKANLLLVKVNQSEVEQLIQCFQTVCADEQLSLDKQH